MSGREVLVSPEVARVYALTQLGGARTRDEKRRALKTAVAAGFSPAEALALLRSDGEALNPFQGVPWADEGMGADAFDPPPWPAWLADQRDPARAARIERLCAMAYEVPGRHTVGSAEAALRERIGSVEHSIENALRVVELDRRTLAEMRALLADGPAAKAGG